MSRSLSAVLALSLLLPLGWSNRHSILAQTAAPFVEESRPQLTVLVYDYARVSAQTLLEAVGRAETIFRHAGLEVQWLQFLPHQPIPKEELDKVDCVVRILSKARARLSLKSTGEALPCDLDGAACFANIFLDRVKEQARQGSLGLDQVLGHAIAHELGHLLLGENSHFSIGLMRATWRKEELQRMAKGDLLFRPEQAKLMQTNLLSRSYREGGDALGNLSSTR